MNTLDVWQSLRPRDTLTAILFLSMLIVGTMLVGFEADFLIVVGLPAAAYVACVIVAPLRFSSPLENDEVARAVGDPSIRLRYSSEIDTRALDIWFQKYLIINSDDLTGICQNWRAVLGHELEHLKQGDSRYFHFAGVTGSASLLMCLYFTTVFLVALLGVGLDSLQERRGWANLLIPMVLVFVSAFFVFWVRQSLHDREFRADRAGRALHSKEFDDWLRREARREEETQIPITEFLARALKWFTHPTFKRRKVAIHTPHRSFPFEAMVLQAFCFLVGSASLSGFMGAFILDSVALNSIVPASYLPFPMVAIITVFLLPIAAGFALVSISTLDAIEQSGKGHGALFVVAVAGLVLLAGMAFAVFMNVTGLDQVLTKDLPERPSSAQRGALYEFFGTTIILANFSFLMFCLNLVVRRWCGQYRYNWIIHMFIGTISIVGAFLWTKAQFLILS